MSATAPPSSPPLNGAGWSSSSALSSCHFSSPQLPYRNIFCSPKPSDLRKNQGDSPLIRPSSPIVASEGFDREYSEDEDKDNDKDEYDGNESEQATGALTDEVFLEEKLVFDSDSFELRG